MRTFPVSGAEIAICSYALTRNIGMLLALDIRALTELDTALHVLYCWRAGKEGQDVKVKTNAPSSCHMGYLSRSHILRGGLTSMSSALTFLKIKLKKKSTKKFKN
jgi:hypothetical protein